MLFIPTFAHASENIFYYYPTKSAYASVKKNYKKIDIIAPQIYTVGYDLKLGKAESEDILELADKKKIDVMPLVVNANFNQPLMSQILASTTAQDAIIADLVEEAKDRDFIGWQFDFENINHVDRDLYTAFVKRTHEVFKKEKLTLSVAVIPRTTPYDPNSTYQDWSSGYSIGDVAKVSDFVSIMSYDDPKSKGPVASIDYVNKALAFTLKDTPAEKISLGIPLYCWQWQSGIDGKIASVVYDTAYGTQKKYKKNGVKKSYSKEHEAELFYFIKDHGIPNFIWCDNEKSVKAKLGVIKKEGLRGLSAWAIGQESKKIWNVLN